MPTLYQPSIGLGIVTHIPEQPTIKESKNDAFFDISTTYSIKPPPSLSQINSGYINHTAVTEQDPLVMAPSFADRIRCIVQASKKSAVVAPIPSYIEKTDSHVHIEKIIPLPSPSQADCIEHQKITQAEVITASSAIPVISLSPNFSPHKTNVIPSLVDEPMLGDIDEIEPTAITRESKFPTPADIEDNLTGKNIWKFHLQKLLGIGAFSKVYLAENVEYGEKVAIKVINKSRLRENMRVKTSIEREVGVLKVIIFFLGCILV